MQSIKGISSTYVLAVLNLMIANLIEGQKYVQHHMLGGKKASKSLISSHLCHQLDYGFYFLQDNMSQNITKTSLNLTWLDFKMFLIKINI